MTKFFTINSMNRYMKRYNNANRHWRYAVCIGLVLFLASVSLMLFASTEKKETTMNETDHAESLSAFRKELTGLLEEESDVVFAYRFSQLMSDRFHIQTFQIKKGNTFLDSDIMIKEDAGGKITVAHHSGPTEILGDNEVIVITEKNELIPCIISSEVRLILYRSGRQLYHINRDSGLLYVQRLAREKEKSNITSY